VKILFLTLAILLFFNFPVSAQNLSNDEINIIHNISESEEDIPDAVRRALMDYIETKRIEDEINKIKIEESEKKEKIDKIFFYSIISALFIVLIFLIKKAGYLHKIKRGFRRQSLYHQIIKLRKKGLSGREIMKVLNIKGYKRKHIDDAIYRYKELHKDENLPSKLELWKQDRSVRGIIRKTRRFYLSIWIRYYILFGKSIEEAGNILLKKGWKERYVNDVVYKYKMNIEGRKNIFIKLFSGIAEISIFHKMRRKARRRKITSKIIRLKKKGLSHSQILKELARQGFQKKYIEDAYARYSHKLYLKEAPQEDDFSIFNIWPFKSIRRKLRRQLLYKKIRKLKKKGLSDANIIETLVEQGNEEKHVSDALYLYNVYKKMKTKNH